MADPQKSWEEQKQAAWEQYVRSIIAANPSAAIMDERWDAWGKAYDFNAPRPEEFQSNMPVITPSPMIDRKMADGGVTPEISGILQEHIGQPASFNIASLPFDDDEIVGGITQHAGFAEDVGGATPIDRVVASSGPRPDKTLTAAVVAGVNSFNAQYAGQYKAGLFGAASATRGAGDKGNHSVGKAYDLAIVDVRTGQTLTNYVGYNGRPGFQGKTQDNLGIYRDLAGSIFSGYVALGGKPEAFRWGGDFSKSDPMHVDLNGTTRAKSFVSVNPELARQLQQEVKTTVTAFQERLKSIGYDVAIDGVLGPKSLAAASKVQADERWAAGFPELAAKRQQGLASQEAGKAPATKQSFEKTFATARSAQDANLNEGLRLRDVLTSTATTRSTAEDRNRGPGPRREGAFTRPGTSSVSPQGLPGGIKSRPAQIADAVRLGKTLADDFKPSQERAAGKFYGVDTARPTIDNDSLTRNRGFPSKSPRAALSPQDIAAMFSRSRQASPAQSPARAAQVARDMSTFRSGEMASRAAPQPDAQRAAQLAQQMATFLAGERQSRAAPQPPTQRFAPAGPSQRFTNVGSARTIATSGPAQRFVNSPRAVPVARTAPVSFRAAQDARLDEGIRLRDLIMSTPKAAAVARVSGPGRKPTIVGIRAQQANDQRRAALARQQELLQMNQVRQKAVARPPAVVQQQAVARAAPVVAAPTRTVAGPTGISQPGTTSAIGFAGVTETGFRGIPDLNVFHGSGGGGGASGGNTFLCTLVYELGGMSEELWQLDRKFGEGVDLAVYQGYAMWARPLASWLRTRPALHSPVIWLVQHWARHMAHVMEPSKYPRAPFGAALHLCGSAVCGMLGRLAQAVAQRDQAVGRLVSYAAALKRSSASAWSRWRMTTGSGESGTCVIPASPHTKPAFRSTPRWKSWPL